MAGNGIDTPETVDFYPQDVRCDKLDVEGTAAFAAAITAESTVDATGYLLNGVPVDLSGGALPIMVGNVNPEPCFFGTARFQCNLDPVGDPPTHMAGSFPAGTLLSIAGLARVVAALNNPYIVIHDLVLQFSNQDASTIVNMIWNGATAEVFDATATHLRNWNDETFRISEGLPKLGGLAPDDDIEFQTDEPDAGFSVVGFVMFTVVEWPN